MKGGRSDRGESPGRGRDWGRATVSPCSAEGRREAVSRRRHRVALRSRQPRPPSSEDSPRNSRGRTDPAGRWALGRHPRGSGPPALPSRGAQNPSSIRMWSGASLAAAPFRLGPPHLVASEPGPALRHLPARAGGPHPGPRGGPERPCGPHPAGPPPAHGQEAPAALPAAGKGQPVPLARAAPARRPARAAPPHLGAHVRHEGGLGRLGAAATADYPFPQHTAALGSSDAREQRRPLGLRQRRRPPALAAGAPPIPRAAAAAAPPASGSAADTARPAQARGPHPLRALADGVGRRRLEATPPPFATGRFVGWRLPFRDRLRATLLRQSPPLCVL